MTEESTAQTGEVVDETTSAPVAQEDATAPVEPVAPLVTEATPQVEPEASTDTETPEWFMKDKYKSVEEQAKSAFELQKKMGKYWGAPTENYTIEGIEGLVKDDPLLENLMPALKDIGLSQEGFSTLVKQYQDANITMMKGLEEQLKKDLTTSDAHVYQDVDKWMTENLSQEERELVQNNWLMSAADFKLFNQMRLMAAPNTSVPSSTTGDAVKFESSSEVENDKIKYRKEVNKGVRVQDKNYENELAKRFRDARGRELRSK